MNTTKTGLVLEGGAMRGIFTAAVTDVLLENNIRLDGVAAVSAGATFGCNYISNQPRRALRYCIKYRLDPRFCSVLSLICTGDLFGAEFCYHTLPEKLDPFDNRRFVQSGIPFYIVTTDVETGKAVYHRCPVLREEELEWVRASASMPLASRIVRVGGHALLDGGITDSIPLQFMQQQGYARNVVVLTQPYGYQKPENSAMPAVRLMYHAYPKLVHAMARRHHVYNEQLQQVAAAEKAGTAFVIRPPRTLPVGHVTHSAARLREVYAIGRKTALKALPKLREFLDK